MVNTVTFFHVVHGAVDNSGGAEAVARRFFVKKVSLEVSQNSQETTCVRVSFLIKLQA